MMDNKSSGTSHYLTVHLYLEDFPVTRDVPDCVKAAMYAFDTPVVKTKFSFIVDVDDSGKFVAHFDKCEVG